MNKGDMRIAVATHSGFLELIILPTENCNFRCTYCYEDFQIGKMSPEIVSGIKKLIEHRLPKLKVFKLNWFGGEPLLAKDQVLDVSQYAKSACEEAGVRFAPGHITTNGYMLDIKTLQRLVDAGQTHYQISLDGFQEGHDTTRKLQSGKGTFEKIWNNLKAAKESNLDFNVVIRLHLTADNLESAERLAQEIDSEFGRDSRFTVFIKPIGNYGKDAGGVALLKGEAANSAISNIEMALNKQSHGDDEQYICYASKPNSLVIRANGNIAKCTVALYDEKNTVGRLNEDGTVQIFGEKMAYWMRGISEQDWDILSCPSYLRSYEKPAEKKIIEIKSVA
ncbi:radical SAM protein [Chromobacterium alticapitis]|uniref:Radical SAM core domain-containing protein n=1 Tax=Chromobacterium alticapitis TaxID=2073169 RepID=A0A2S5DJ25_9NEIS|nr:radical SAM protein [Chromobacterium alticapitis]POZ63076.1 hypothetical protein C2I19_04515 [Chromobacterium alticapitis]